ncbi:MAG: hypothetical protein ACLGJB_11455 [Blastocatellia bacterium]
MGSLKNENAMVIFEWWQAVYKFAVPSSVLEELMENPESRHILFSAKSRYGDSTFYLEATPQGTIEVLRKKHWLRGDKGISSIDTTILYEDS